MYTVVLPSDGTLISHLDHTYLGYQQNKAKPDTPTLTTCYSVTTARITRWQQFISVKTYCSIVCMCKWFISALHQLTR